MLRVKKEEIIYSRVIDVVTLIGRTAEEKQNMFELLPRSLTTSSI